MKVRLYRGPGDGKILYIGSSESIVEIESLADDPYNTFKSTGQLTVQTVKSMYLRTKHTHPDGSVYFEWNQPRGKKSGVKQKPRTKKQSIYFNPYNTTITNSTSGSQSGLTYYATVV